MAATHVAFVHYVAAIFRIYIILIIFAKLHLIHF